MGANAAGAKMTYLNGFGVPVGVYTLTGDMIQSIPVPYFAAGSAYNLTMSTLSTSAIVNFVELFAFTNTGQNVAAAALGATAAFTAGTVYSASGTSQLAAYGNDLITDPYVVATLNLPSGLMAGTTGAGAWTVTFPVANPLYWPLPQPYLIASVVMINRLDCSVCLLRMNGAVVTLTGPNNTVVQSNVISLNSATQLTASTINFVNNAQAGPIFPNSSLAQPGVAALQSSPFVNTFVRYINITSAPGKCLHFRELYVFDSSYTNVALYKPTVQNAGGVQIANYYDSAFGFTSVPSYGVDGVIDMDNSVGFLAVHRQSECTIATRTSAPPPHPYTHTPSRTTPGRSVTW